MSTPIAAPAGSPALHPLLGRLVAETGAALLEASGFDAWAGMPGAAMAVFAEDPERYKETLDLAVIVPELCRAFPDRFRVGVLLPEAARAIAVRYGFRRWPALVVLADGKYVGAVDGLRNWDEYLAEVAGLLAAAPTRPPTLGIAVKGNSEGAASCH